ncbi:MAG: FHA domain-containing protein [Actinomycetia bacterium]|nr:FHA domain-containing protein [Actinomycetes bacterium]MCP4962937.1 FHA domain-containing protein [Actinomycetes bacterium]
MSQRVRGIASPSQYVNHPKATFCRSSGVRLGASRTRHLAETTRPPVMVLVFEDGSSTAIRDLTTIGTASDNHLQVGTADGSVSRRHLEIRVEGWSVLICDLGSTNGTWRCHSSKVWERMSPNRNVPLEPGDRVAFGDRWLTVHPLW